MRHEAGLGLGMCDINKPHNLPPRRSNWLFWGLSATVSSHFATAYTLLLARGFDYERYAYGQVDYPARTRVLMSFVFRWVILAAQRIHYSPQAGARIDLLGGTTLFAVMVSMMTTIWATRKSIQVLLGEETPWLWVAFLVPYMAYFHFILIAEIRVQTPYDLPSVAFYALALYSILAQRRALFYVVLAAGTANRETTIFLPFLFLFQQLYDDRRPVEAPASFKWPQIGELAAQLALWSAVHIWAASTVAGGEHLWQHHLRQNIHFIFDPLHWPTMASVFGFLWIPYLIFFKEIPSVYMRRCGVLLVPWFVLMVLFGDLLEIRIHSEWIPYFAVCMALLCSSRAKSVSEHTAVV